MQGELEFCFRDPVQSSLIEVLEISNPNFWSSIVFIVVSSEVENLKAELDKAKREAADHKMAADHAAAELSSLKAVSEKHEARVAEVQQELQDASTNYKALEQKAKDQAARLSTLSFDLKSERVDRRSYEEELR